MVQPGTLVLSDNVWPPLFFRPQFCLRWSTKAQKSTRVSLQLPDIFNCFSVQLRFRFSLCFGCFIFPTSCYVISSTCSVFQGSGSRPPISLHANSTRNITLCFQRRVALASSTAAVLVTDLLVIVLNVLLEVVFGVVFTVVVNRITSTICALPPPSAASLQFSQRNMHTCDMRCILLNQPVRCWYRYPVLHPLLKS